MIGHVFDRSVRGNHPDPLARGCCPYKEEHPVHNLYVRGWELTSPGEMAAAANSDNPPPTPEFWHLRIEWETGDPIVAIFPTEKDCHKVLGRYNGYSKVTIQTKALDDPSRF